MYRILYILHVVAVLVHVSNVRLNNGSKELDIYRCAYSLRLNACLYAVEREPLEVVSPPFELIYELSLLHYSHMFESLLI